MKNLWTTIMVKDMEASMAFYNEILDLKVDRKMTTPDQVEIVFLGEGETKFELIYNPNLKDIQHSNFVSTGFETDTLDEVITLLENKKISFEGPFQPAPFIQFIYVKDPNGYKIQIVQHL
ncbi:MAG: VOC family protein [Clostridia bacterium]|nr:VOC family protein [Clostridia bacterium]